MTDGFKCRRCGKCCENQGTIWLHSTNPVITHLRRAMEQRGILADFCRDDVPCDMLQHEIRETPAGRQRAVCLLEKHLGWNAKPAVCRDYPAEGQPCMRDESEVK